MSRRRIVFDLAVTILLCAGCGGGGGSDDNDNILTRLIGNWSGVVVLSDNGCDREIPAEFQTLTFKHGVTASFNTATEADVTLIDGTMVCRALRVNPDSDLFEAVCPDNPLPGFVAGLNCKEQRVWDYRLASEGPDPVFADIIRTAFVRCTNNAEIDFACPVTYTGSASRDD